MRWDHLCWLIVLFGVWLLPSYRNLGVGYYLSFQRDGPRSCEEYPRFVENLHVKMAEKEFIITSFLKYFISKVMLYDKGGQGHTVKKKPVKVWSSWGEMWGSLDHCLSQEILGNCCLFDDHRWAAELKLIIHRETARDHCETCSLMKPKRLISSQKTDFSSKYALCCISQVFICGIFVIIKFNYITISLMH